jgi:hypothetical protein
MGIEFSDEHAAPEPRSLGLRKSNCRIKQPGDVADPAIHSEAARFVRELLDAGEADAVIVLGGPPCQTYSSGQSEQVRFPRRYQSVQADKMWFAAAGEAAAARRRAEDARRRRAAAVRAGTAAGVAEAPPARRGGDDARRRRGAAAGGSGGAGQRAVGAASVALSSGSRAAPTAEPPLPAGQQSACTRGDWFLGNEEAPAPAGRSRGPPARLRVSVFSGEGQASLLRTPPPVQVGPAPAVEAGAVNERGNGAEQLPAAPAPASTMPGAPLEAQPAGAPSEATVAALEAAADAAERRAAELEMLAKAVSSGSQVGAVWKERRYTTSSWLEVQLGVE